MGRRYLGEESSLIASRERGGDDLLNGGIANLRMIWRPTGVEPGKKKGRREKKSGERERVSIAIQSKTYHPCTPWTIYKSTTNQ